MGASTVAMRLAGVFSVGVAVSLGGRAWGSPMTIELSAPIRGIVAFPEDTPLRDIFGLGQVVDIALTYDPDAPEEGDTLADPDRGDYVDPSVAFTVSIPEVGLTFEVSGSATQEISTTNDLMGDGAASDFISTSVAVADGGTVAGLLDGRTPDQMGLVLSDVAELPTLPDMLTSDALPVGTLEPRFAGITFTFLMPTLPVPTFETLILNLDFGADPGSSPDDPILPDDEDDGVFVFFGVPSGVWIDPPGTTGYVYEMTGDSLFTDILAFPPSFDGPFEVLVGDVPLGSFGVEESVSFASFSGVLGGLLVDGVGVEAFTVTGISPPVDSDDPWAFPIQLGFSTETADLTMTPIPEPGVGVLLGVAGLVALGRRR